MNSKTRSIPSTHNDLQTLESCEAYPIRNISHIQPHGILLVLKSDDWTVVQVSENTRAGLGISAQSLLGKPLTLIFSNEDVEGLKTFLQQSEPFCAHRIAASITRLQFWAYLHPQEDVILIELEPQVSEAVTLSRLPQQLSRITTGLTKTKTTQEFSQLAAKELRSFINFDRVMVYQFLPDNSGVVIAEEKKDTLVSYLGLHYPATDIPEEARAIFTEIPFRWIPDVNYESVSLIPENNPLTQAPLDISVTWLRGVSPPHVEYLNNMEVVSSISIPLIDENGLWGLIACHHSEPTCFNAETRSSFLLLSEIFSLNLFRQQHVESDYFRDQNSALLAALRAATTQDESSFQKVLIHNSDLLLDIFKSEGLALIFDGDIELVGTTPSEAEVRSLMHWVRKYHPTPTFSTTALSQAYAQQNDALDLPAGFLSISVISPQVHSKAYYILLFRAEQPDIFWAGQLSDSAREDENGELGLCPRKSFELWKETVRGKSLPWSLYEIESATDLHSILLLAALNFSAQALKEATQKAEIANRTKGEFLANMSHEIRTPMNAVIGMTELLSETNLTAQQRSCVSVIRTGSDTLLTVINDILDVSKIESGKLVLEKGRLDLHQCVSNVIALFSHQATERKISLTSQVDLGRSNGLFKGDLIRLRQVLTNFVGNSLKFTERGEIGVFVKVRSTNLSPDAETAGDHQFELEFEVRDTGIGISESHLKKLFQPFSQADASITRKYGGTGLGLAINKQLIELMGGKMWVTSDVGKGTIFGFVIKLEPYENFSEANHPSQKTDLNQPPVAEQFSMSSSTEPTVIAEKPLRILLAEDIPLNQVVALKVLRSCGYDADVANNGKETIKALQHQRYDLVLMDIQMPELDGLAATQQIRLDPDIVQPRIIAMTANAMQGDRETYLDAGMDGYISKPIRKCDLAMVLEENK